MKMHRKLQNVCLKTRHLKDERKEGFEEKRVGELLSVFWT